MSIYGFYSTNLVLRRPETSATDKSHFRSFDAPSVYLSSFSVRRPIRFRPPSDRIPSAVRLDSVRGPIGLRSPSTEKVKKNVLSERLVMGFVCEGEQFTVAPAVAERLDVVVAAVRREFGQLLA